MFNSIAFDVVIGLIFIYILYSLLATILGELFASVINLRTVMLRISIERMLNDSFYEEPHIKEKEGFLEMWHWLTFRPHPEFDQSFAGKFYNYPAIRYLGKVDQSRFNFESKRPSYLGADIFADTIMNMLKDKGTGSTPMERMGFSLQYNTWQVQKQTLKNIKNLYDTAKKDETTFKDNLKNWYNETQQRTTGWYKRKMQLVIFCIGLIIAVVFNVNTIRIARTLSTDKDARAQLVNMGVALSKDTARYSAVMNANGDSAMSKGVIDTGLARVNRDLMQANEVLGIGWDFSSKTIHDTFREFHNEYDFLDMKYDSAYLPFLRWTALLREYRDMLRIKQARIIRAARDTAYRSNYYRISPDESRAGDLRKSKEHLLEMIKSADSLQSVIFEDSLITAGLGQRVADQTLKINGLLKKDYKSIDIIYNPAFDVYRVVGERKYTSREKWHFLGRELWTEWGLIGFVLTALAISLGAPFWFDLLAKFVSIRGSGAKPEEKKQEPNANPADPNNPAKGQTGNTNPPPPTPEQRATKHAIDTTIVNQAIAKEGAALKAKFPNILYLHETLMIENGSRIAAIGIYLKDNNTSGLPTEVKIDFNEEVLTVLTYVIPGLGTAATHAGLNGKVANINSRSYTGSACCVLTDNNSNYYLLTNGHVMTGNDLLSPLYNTGTPKVVYNNVPIGEWYYGLMSTDGDFAVSTITNFKKFSVQYNPLQYNNKTKEIGKDDWLTLQVKVQGNLSEGSAYIINVKQNVFELPYNLAKSILFKEIIVLGSIPDEKNCRPVTQKGDSGGAVYLNNELIGIITAGDDKYTYALPVKSFIDNLHLKLV